MKIKRERKSWTNGWYSFLKNDSVKYYRKKKKKSDNEKKKSDNVKRKNG